MLTESATPPTQTRPNWIWICAALLGFWRTTFTAVLAVTVVVAHTVMVVVVNWEQ